MYSFSDLFIMTILNNQQILHALFIFTCLLGCCYVVRVNSQDESAKSSQSRNVYFEGREAFKKGKGFDTNPHLGCVDRVLWLDG